MPKKVILTDADEKNICRDFTDEYMSVRSLSSKYHVGELKIQAILTKYGLQVSERKRPRISDSFIVKDPNTPKYKPIEGEHYIIYDEKTGYETNDLYNQGGHLTSYINKQYNIEIPSLLERTKYYQQTGNYWWEQWLKVKSVKNAPVKHCPYCDWTTEDVENKSGAFTSHLLNIHNMTVEDYLKEHPEDKDYFALANPIHQLQRETDETKFIRCEICGRKLKRMASHLKRKHNMTLEEYVSLYPKAKLLSDDFYELSLKLAEKGNIALGSMHYERFSSAPERELGQFLTDNNIEWRKDRALLHGQELDIYIPSMNIAIEFNGLKWHTDYFGGKDRNYHVNKLNMCNASGVRLITIFEDEYFYHKDVVLDKLKHILHIETDDRKIHARKTTIQEISKQNAALFLNENHIQGSCNGLCTVLGAFYGEELVGVMGFTNRMAHETELTRFATKRGTSCVGLASKMLKYFISNYEYESIVSFADRCWTSNTDNLYLTLGFKLDKILPPAYWYYKEAVDKHARLHRFGFRKDILLRKYHTLLKPEMTETEMTKILGYDRIWDCGLLRYVYKNPEI